MKKELNINITLDSEEDYRNLFNKNRLSTEFSNYIYEECKGEPLNSDILITISPSFTMSKSEKEELVDMIKKNYGTDVKENLLFLERSFIWKTILFLLGVFIVAISYFAKTVDDYIISEVILIVGWVAIWESVYSWIFEDGKKKVEIKRLKRLANCRVEFK